MLKDSFNIRYNVCTLPPSYLRLCCISHEKKNNNVEAAVMKIDAMPDFFVGDMCIINKLVGDMHQQTDGIANSGKQTGLVNKYMTSHEE